MSTVPVSQHPASVDHYIRHGWQLVPLPPGSKGPRTEGWNRRESTLTSSDDLPPGWGIGLAHAYSGTMALDIDDYDAAREALAPRGVDLDALFAAPDAVTIDSGRSGHGKLLYATPMGMPIPSRKFTLDGRAVYDLRCATANGFTAQDVLPPSIHPDTKQPYRWGGAGHWTRLPVVPDALMAVWLAPAPPVTPAPAPSGPVDWTEVQRALSAIDPDCSRDQWIQVGMALHHAGGEEGLAVWNEWSARGQKYPGERAIAQQWRAFRTDKPTMVTLGTLFAFAAEGGFVRAPIDASPLFKPISISPADLKAVVRAPPPTMNFDLWPPVLRERVAKLAEATSCDPLVPLWAGLAAAAGAADARSRLKLMEGWEMPPVIWLCTIGDPSSKKTPGSTPMKAPLAALEAEDRPRYARAMLDWEMRHAIWATDRKTSLEWAKTEERALGGEPPQLQEEPERPVALRIAVADITSQKLVRLAAGLPRGLVCWLDEMNTWCNRLTDTRSGEQRSTWTEAYDAKPYTIDRVGDGTIHAENYAISIYGNIQPQIYQQHVKALAADGFLQRFVPAVLAPAKRGLNNPIPKELDGSAEWDFALRCIHALPPLTYTLSPEAFEAFREFQRWHIQRTWDDVLLNRGPIYLTAMGKLDGTVGRFAFIMHLLTEPFSTVVSAATMNAAIEVAKGYMVPVLRHVFGEMAGESVIDAWVADYIVQYADLPAITLSQLKRGGRKQLESYPTAWMQDQAIMGAMARLEDAGWVMRADDGTMEQRHFAQWTINPQLMQQYAGHRAEVIAARQRDLDYIYKLSTKGRKITHGFEGGRIMNRWRDSG